LAIFLGLHRELDAAAFTEAALGRQADGKLDGRGRTRAVYQADGEVVALHGIDAVADGHQSLPGGGGASAIEGPSSCCPMRSTTNSAGTTGATPISMTSWPSAARAGPSPPG